MSKRINIIERKIYDERCGDCFYNEEGECNKNPIKCIYNQPVIESEDSTDEDEEDQI